MMLFEYNSNILFNAGTAGVREQAENLPNLLVVKRAVRAPYLIANSKIIELKDYRKILTAH